MTSDWLRPSEAAAELQIRKPTVYSLIESGQLAAIDVSVNSDAKRASYRIPREALERFIQSRVKRQPTAQPARVRRTSPARFYS